MHLPSLPRICAGFPSPGELFAEQPLDVNDLLRPHAATHFLQVEGDSMREACIFDGDILFVDRDLSPTHGELIVARLERNLVLRRLQIMRTHLVLEAAHPHVPPIIVQPEMDYQCWAVVLFIISPRHMLAQSRLRRAGPSGP